jgi:hypothetical protein
VAARLGVRFYECHAQLTPEVYAHGLALALLQGVLVRPMRTRGQPRKMRALERPAVVSPVRGGGWSRKTSRYTAAYRSPPA